MKVEAEIRYLVSIIIFLYNIKVDVIGTTAYDMSINTTNLWSYLRHVVDFQVVDNEVFLRQLYFQQLKVVQQLFPLNDLLYFLRFVPFIRGGNILRGDRCLQTEILRL